MRGAALAALAVGHRIEAVSYTITEGYAVGVATVVGQWRGAGNNERAAESAFQASRYGALSMVPLSLLAFAFAPAASSFFAPDPAVSQAAANYLRAVAWCFPFCAVEACFDGGCIGAQRSELAGHARARGRRRRAENVLAVGVDRVGIPIPLGDRARAPSRLDGRLEAHGRWRLGRGGERSPAQAGGAG